jgi:hypothetical protein
MGISLCIVVFTELPLLLSEYSRYSPESHDLVGRHSAVRASEVQILWLLRPSKVLEVIWISLLRLLHPLSIVLQDISHMLSHGGIVIFSKGYEAISAVYMVAAHDSLIVLLANHGCIWGYFHVQTSSKVKRSSEFMINNHSS